MSVIFPLPHSDRTGGPFTATAGQVDFPGAYPIQRASDVTVTRTRAGVPATLALGETQDYIILNAGNPAGFTIRLMAPALAGDIITHEGAASLDRLTSVAQNGRFSAAQTDAEFDRNRIIDQELRRDIDAIRLPDIQGWGAAGPLAGRAAHDAEAPGFTYLVTDQGALVYYVRSGAAGTWLGPYAANAAAVVAEHEAEPDPHPQYQRNIYAPLNFAAMMVNQGRTFAAGLPGSVVAGRIITTQEEGFRYRIMAAVETDPDVTLPEGINLRVVERNGVLDLAAWGIAANGNIGPVFAKALARADVIFPKTPHTLAGQHTIDLPADRQADFNGCPLTVAADGSWRIRGPEITPAKTLAANQLQHTSQLTLNNATGVAVGMILGISANDAPALDGFGGVGKSDTKTITAVAGAVVSFARPLNFHYNTGEAGLAVSIRTKRRFRGRNLNIFVPNAISGPQAPFEFYGIEGGIDSVVAKGPDGYVTNSGTSELIRVVALYDCVNCTFTDWLCTDIGYPIMPALGSLNTRVSRIDGFNCRHLVVPTRWPDGVHVEDATGINCEETIDAHTSFNVTYERVRAINDKGLGNMRCGGGGLTDVDIHTTVGNGNAAALFHNLVPAPNYSYLYSDPLNPSQPRVFTTRGRVRWRAPNRTNEVFAVYRGRADLQGLDLDGEMSVSGGGVGQASLIWGPNNRIKGRPFMNTKLCRATDARVDIPPRLNAELRGDGFYHIDLFGNFVGVEGRTVKVEGTIIDMITGSTTSTPAQVDVVLRLHEYAFPGVDDITRVVSQFTLIMEEVNTSNSWGGVPPRPPFSRIEKNYQIDHLLASNLVTMDPWPQQPAVIGPLANSYMDAGLLAGSFMQNRIVGGDSVVGATARISGFWPNSKYALRYRWELINAT